MEQEYFGNSVSQWILATAIFAVVMLGLGLVLRVVVNRLEKFSGRTRTDLDNLAADLLKRTKFFFVFLVSIWAASQSLELNDTITGRIGFFLIFGFLAQAGLWATTVISYFLDDYKRRQLEIDPGIATAVGALNLIAKLIVWTVVLLMIVDNIEGVEVTTLVAGLGIGGIAVALALQNVLGDLFASLSIIFDKPFVIGDFIIVGDHMGTVEHVGLKTSRVRSISGEQLIFSNSDLLQSRIRNYKRMDERRILFEVGVTYGTPYDSLKKIPTMIREIIEAQENCRFDRAHFKGYGDSSLDFETVYYMLVPDYAAYMDSQEAINFEIFRRFADEGLEFAFPTRTVHLYQENGAAAGGEQVPPEREASSPEGDRRPDTAFDPDERSIRAEDGGEGSSRRGAGV